jgi:hypothetical protein
MNIVKITDGLGNQMFQYAFARSLQANLGKAVYLDTRFINNEDAAIRKEDNKYWSRKIDIRKYGLDNFQITLPEADNSILKHWDYLWNIGSPKNKIYELKKNGFGFWKYADEDKSGIKIKPLLPTYYKGYFFDLKYYDDIKATLQKEFVLSKKIVLPAELKSILKKENSVSVHIRRGDFLKVNRDISQKDYYPKALDLMSQKVNDPVYLVFSDDIEWVRDNLKIDSQAVYVSEMGFQDCEELMIMKHCRHNIIANSTFSYWAAYLNSNPNKTVICPKNWKTKIIPDAWIKI